MRYVIGSGWWSAGDSLDTRSELLGDDRIRGKDFHQLWYASVNRFTDPQKIIIVDSCSPVKPQLNREDSRLEFVSYNLNAGHNTNHVGKFSGLNRALLLGLEYARHSDTDYYVNVEQDCLLFGKGIIEHCIRHMRTPYMLGSGVGTPQKTQISLFIVRQDGILPLIQRLNAMPETDNEICPEDKLHIVCSKGPPSLHAAVYKRAEKSALFGWWDWQFFKYLTAYDLLPIGYGRARPVKFEDDMFYFQHGTSEELARYLKRTGFEFSFQA